MNALFGRVVRMKALFGTNRSIVPMKALYGTNRELT